MKTLQIEFEEPNLDVWRNLPTNAKKLLTEKALNAILNGALYPTGTDQLELAIDLAEAGVDAEAISKLTHLDKSIFEAFLQ